MTTRTTLMTTTRMTNKPKKKRAIKPEEEARRKRQRARALPSPNAISFTIPDFQSMGGPGKTSLYNEDKRRKENGEKRLLFKDAFGRTKVDGDMGRELLSIKEDAS
jgi:hypothetical protein